MRFPRPWILISLCFFLPTISHAAFTLPNLTQGDFNNVIKEFSADMSYSSVTPASSLGGWGGFELGIVGGETNTPDIQTLVYSAGASTNVKVLPHAGAVGRLGIPFGITAEILVLPTVKASSVNLREIGGALEWTLSDILLTDFPVNVAVKGFYNKAHLDFSQNLTYNSVSTTGTVSLDDSIYGGQLLISKKIFFLEPYAGIGEVTANGTTTVSSNSGTGTIDLFTFAVPGTSQSANSKPSSFQAFGGLDIRLGLFSLGAEAMNAFNRNSYTGRISFRF